MKTERIIFRTDLETSSKLKKLAENDNRTMSDFINLLIKKTLDNKNGNR